MKSVYCSVRTGSLNKAVCFVFKRLIYYGLIYKSSNIGVGCLLEQTFLSLNASHPSIFNILYHKTAHTRQKYHYNWHSVVKQIEDKTNDFTWIDETWNARLVALRLYKLVLSRYKIYIMGRKKFKVSNYKLLIAVEQIFFFLLRSGVLKRFAAFYGNGAFVAVFTRALFWSVMYTKSIWFNLLKPSGFFTYHPV